MYLYIVLKAFKYRIFPNTEQKERLTRCFGVIRVIYNLGLEVKTIAYAKNKTSISQYDLINQLPDLKQEYEWIKECPSQSLQHVIINLDTAYKNFFKGRAEFPKFKNRFSKQSISFPQGVSIDFENSTITLPKLKTVNIDFSRKFKGEMKTVTLSKTTTNKYFVSILIETGVELPKKVNIERDTTVGIDFGIKDLAITSNGVKYENNNFFKSQQKKLRIEQRSLAKKVKGSNRREKQRLKVALLHEKIRNQRTDYLHKISTELVSNNDTIVIEDLTVSNMVKNHHLAKSISDVGWRKLRIMLEYKANWRGKNLKVIGRFEPSSKICSNCGHYKTDLKLSDRIYFCEMCSTKIDRDINAALNIKNFGLRIEPVSRKRRAGSSSVG